MVPTDIHDFFATSGGAAAALIGLLFVAISVSADRLAREEAGSQLHRIRAVAALTAFTNALAISLFSLVPGQSMGWTAVVLAIVGLMFVVAAIVSLIRLHEVRWSTVRDGVFLIGLLVTFVSQLLAGAGLIAQARNSGDVDTLAVLVIVCFLIGVARAWELIGGPSIGLRQEVTALVRGRPPTADKPGDGEPPPGERPGRGA